MRWPPPAAPSSSWPWPMCFRADWPAAMRVSQNEYPQQVDVPKERQFIGFDAYQKAMDCLKPGDVVILTTPCAFRGVHFNYAIEKGLNVFMEKPTTVDGPSTRRMLALADLSEKKNLEGRRRTDVPPLQSPLGTAGSDPGRPDRRHHVPEDLSPGHTGGFLRSQAGGHERTAVPGPELPELHVGQRRTRARFHEPQHRRVLLDERFLARARRRDGRPILSRRGSRSERRSLLGRIHVRRRHQSVCQARNMEGCHGRFASYAHGTKGSADHLDVHAHAGRVPDLQGHNFDDDQLVWSASKPEPNPYQLEWDHLIDAIRNDKPYNEAKRGAEASLVQIMGRMAVNTGRIITWDEALNHEHELAPGLDKLTMDSPAPLPVGPDGKYPLPQPGMITEREY